MFDDISIESLRISLTVTTTYTTSNNFTESWPFVHITIVVAETRTAEYAAYSRPRYRVFRPLLRTVVSGLTPRQGYVEGH